MGTSLRLESRLRSTKLMAVMTIAVIALCLRTAGSVLDHSGATLVGDVLIVFGLLIPSLSNALQLKEMEPAPALSHALFRWAAGIAYVGWTILCISALWLGTSAPEGVTWRTALFDPLVAGTGLLWLCVASAVIALCLILYAIATLSVRLGYRANRNDSLHQTALTAQAVVTCLCAPILLLVSLLAITERVLHLGIFPAESTLTIQLGWLALHPLLLSSLLPVLGLVLDSFGVASGRATRLAQIALWSVALCFVLSSGQNAFDAGISELVAISSSFYALLTCAPLLTLFVMGCEAAARALRLQPWPMRLRLSALALLVCAAFLLLALRAALPALSMGFDIVLFGAYGRTLLLCLVLLGLALSVSSWGPQRPDSTEQATPSPA